MKRYFNSLFILLVATLLLVFGFNRIVNPYDIFSGPVIERFNSAKPEALTRQRMSKAYQVSNIKPQAIILGTSRALALDPAQPHWNQLASFNLALTSSSIYEQWRYLQHAQEIQPLREVVIGLDHFMFNHNTGKNFSEQRLAVNPDGSSNHLLLGYDPKDLMAGLLSFDALRSSLVTVTGQGPVTSAAMAKRQRVIANGGHRAMFTEMERTIFQEYAVKTLTREYSEIGSYESPGSFRKMLRFTYQHDIRLYLFFSPSHARLWEAWRIVGLAPELDDWKRAVIAANEEEALMSDRQAVPVWEFSGYNSVTTERLPRADEVEQLMFGYWEGSHYSDEVGELVLNRMFGEVGPARKVPDDFGVMLSSRNIDEHLAKEHRAAEEYRRANRGEIQEMENLFNYYKKKSLNRND